MNKICPEGKVLNPITGRCINIKVVKTVKPVKAVKPVKSDKEDKPVKSGKVAKVAKVDKVCPEGKVLNPITGRCINKKEVKPIKDVKPIKPIKDVKQLKPDKVCPDGKVLNPITGRCINKKAVKPDKSKKVSSEKKISVNTHINDDESDKSKKISVNTHINDDESDKSKKVSINTSINDVEPNKSKKVSSEKKVLDRIVNKYVNKKIAIDNNKLIIDNLTILVEYETLNNNIFKARAYGKVISSIEMIDFQINNIEDIKQISGVGVKIEIKILELLTTGKILIVEKALKDPYYILHKKLKKIYGVGNVKIKELMKKIMYFEELKNKPELLNDKQKIGLKYYDDINSRIPIEEGKNHYIVIDKIFKTIYKNIDFEIVGSYRRKNKDMGDIDILIKNTNNIDLKVLITELKNKGYIIETLADGKSKFMGLCKLSPSTPARRIDILISNPSTYYFALLYFTGSFAFNIYMRKEALKQNISLSEYGFKNKDNKLIDTSEIIKSEEDIFKYLKLPYVLPEQR